MSPQRPGLQLELAHLHGHEGRPGPFVRLVLAQQMQDQDRDLACRRHRSHVHSLLRLDAEEEGAQRSGNRCGGPAPGDRGRTSERGTAGVDCMNRRRPSPIVSVLASLRGQRPGVRPCPGAAPLAGNDNLAPGARPVDVVELAAAPRRSARRSPAAAPTAPGCWSASTRPGRRSPGRATPRPSARRCGRRGRWCEGKM